MSKWRKKWFTEIADCTEGVGSKYQDAISDCIVEADIEIGSLLTDRDGLVRYVRASDLETLMLARSSRSTDGMQRWMDAKEAKNKAYKALSQELRDEISKESSDEAEI